MQRDKSERNVGERVRTGTEEKIEHKIKVRCKFKEKPKKTEMEREKKRKKEIILDRNNKN